ncbi:helix-turn-helix domain-containing protein [Actinopolymorpha pittospori]|uniref:Transcriptional regulator with XRE-family HTH domain n=1 Tax=Actinopolymorpha pittospori TaxID=648752 RepID=A0A927N5P0_9ACTN|nr:helix-turn-helix transcriptional regulator [Actinopolymorpha pittospori]MBE1612142.1 transcriptional regulator with XRE-family HTH domain [Actinopolymorpha pittospori]
MDMSQVLRGRRRELGLSQTQLAQATGVHMRQIRRYEAGEQQPLFPVAVAIAKALDISLAELAGMPTHRINLTGDWWASWQTSKDHQQVITAQEIRIDQQVELIHAVTTTRGTSAEDGHMWSGELRLWDNEILTGWYTAADGSVRSKGTVYIVLHAHGDSALGRWVGLSDDRQIMTGRVGLAKSEDDARGIIDQPKANEPNQG